MKTTKVLRRMVPLGSLISACVVSFAGAFGSHAQSMVRSASRDWQGAGQRTDEVGFRVARKLLPQQ